MHNFQSGQLSLFNTFSGLVCDCVRIKYRHSKRKSNVAKWNFRWPKIHIYDFNTPKMMPLLLLKYKQIQFINNNNK